MKVVVAGATGLVGSACITELLRQPQVTEIVALLRRTWPQAPSDPRIRPVTVDFAVPDTAFAANGPIDAVICALGTTMRQAGSQEAFRQVDYGYPVALATVARAHDVPHFLLVSALGASADSPVFYNRVKGETEAAIRALGFPRVTIVRPSLLVGPREELRPLELLMRIAGLVAPPRLRPVKGTQVASALVHAAAHPAPGVQLLENAALRRF